MKLDECRTKIDVIDAEIIALLNRRGNVAKEIGVLKAKAGLPIIDSAREREVLRRVSRQNAGPVSDEAAAGIFNEILNASRNIQFETLAELSKNGEIYK